MGTTSLSYNLGIDQFKDSLAHIKDDNLKKLVEYLQNNDSANENIENIAISLGLFPCETELQPEYIVELSGNTTSDLEDDI